VIRESGESALSNLITFAHVCSSRQIVFISPLLSEEDTPSRDVYLFAKSLLRIVDNAGSCERVKQSTVILHRQLASRSSIKIEQMGPCI